MKKRFPFSLLLLVLLIGCVRDHFMKNTGGSSHIRQDVQLAAVPRPIKNMYYEDRFPDIYLIMKPYTLGISRSKYQKILSGENPPTPASHGSTWRYDTDVPIYFYGKGIKEGYLAEKANLIDIAPTLAYLTGTQVPAAATGQIIYDILKPSTAWWGRDDFPRAVVLISLDQCRKDYFSRYADAWSFTKNEIIKKGSSFTTGRLSYAKSATCVSHSVVGTGAIPSRTGILGNIIYDSTSDTFTLAIDDGATGNMSPKNLLVPTLADELDQNYNNRSVVISMSAYGRAAIGIAGHGAWLTGGDKDIVLSLNRFSGLPYTNTNYYTLPSYLKIANNRAVKIDKWLRANYKRPDGTDFDIINGRWTETTAIVDYSPWAVDTTHKRIIAAKAKFSWGESFTFDHPMVNSNEPYPGDRQTSDGNESTSSYFDETAYTPFYDLWVQDLLLMTMKRESVGKDGVPDFVFYHQKIFDKVGHRYGVNSSELYNYMHYADYSIEKLKTWLDREVGADNYVMVIFADHGANNVMCGGQWVVREERNAAIEDEFGEGVIKSFVADDQLWLSKDVLSARGKTVKDVAEWMKKNFNWLKTAYTKEEVRKSL